MAIGQRPNVQAALRQRADADRTSHGFSYVINSAFPLRVDLPKLKVPESLPSKSEKMPKPAVKSFPSTLELTPEEQEAQYVHQVYDKIAPHFSQTRYK
ncbi:hypothetical protein FRC05_006162, partial [Tulasnella sp. 425]